MQYERKAMGRESMKLAKYSTVADWLLISGVNKFILINFFFF